MTRSVTIVNSSNWDGEDYAVKVGDGPKYFIEPGDKIMFCVYSKEIPISIIPLQSKEPEPFKDKEGKQILPIVEVTWQP